MVTDHLFNLGLQTASDAEVWEYARDNKFTIVTLDSDFNERGLLYGYPPKIVWLRTRNVSTKYISGLLRERVQDILAFGEDKTLGCLQIY